MTYCKFLFLFIGFSMFGQEVLTLEPKIGKTYDFSQERQEQWVACDSIMYSPIGEKQTPAERFVLQEKCYDFGYNEACESIWSVVCGNDWTDEGYPYDRVDLTKAYNYASYIKQNPDYKFNTVSSELKPQGTNEYGSNSISDLSYKTAWVEGVKGYGIGETIDFKFKLGHPRITTVIIANGYIKSKEIWKNNSRVKQLRMYLNNKPFAILNLKDVYAEQTFEIPTIGYEYHFNNDGTTWYRYKDENGRTVKSYNKKSELLEDIIRFEISAVYKGDKYDDTAITEIYFDGLDVH